MFPNWQCKKRRHPNTLKSSQRMGGGWQNSQKYLRAPLFNKNLSNETTLTSSISLDITGTFKYCSLMSSQGLFWPPSYLLHLPPLPLLQSVCKGSLNLRTTQREKRPRERCDRQGTCMAVNAGGGGEVGTR